MNSGYCRDSSVLPGPNSVEFNPRASNRSVRNGVECIAWNVASNGVAPLDRLTANCQTNGYRMWYNKAVRILWPSKSKRSDTIAYDHLFERQRGQKFARFIFRLYCGSGNICWLAMFGHFIATAAARTHRFRRVCDSQSHSSYNGSNRTGINPKTSTVWVHYRMCLLLESSKSLDPTWSVRPDFECSPSFWSHRCAVQNYASNYPAFEMPIDSSGKSRNTHGLSVSANTAQYLRQCRPIWWAWIILHTAGGAQEGARKWNRFTSTAMRDDITRAECKCFLLASPYSIDPLNRFSFAVFPTNIMWWPQWYGWKANFIDESIHIEIEQIFEKDIHR